MPEAPLDLLIGLEASCRDRGVAVMRRLSRGFGALTRKRFLIHGIKSDFDVRTPMNPSSNNSLLRGLSTVRRILKERQRHQCCGDILHEPETVFVLLYADSVLRVGRHGRSGILGSHGWVGGSAGVAASVRRGIWVLQRNGDSWRDLTCRTSDF